MTVNSLGSQTSAKFDLKSDPDLQATLLVSVLGLTLSFLLLQLFDIDLGVLALAG